MSAPSMPTGQRVSEHHSGRLRPPLPTLRLVALVLVAVLFTGISVLGAVWWWLLANALVALVAAIDYLRAARPSRLWLYQSHGAIASMGSQLPLTVAVENRNQGAINLTLLADVALALGGHSPAATLAVLAERRAMAQLTLTAATRGLHAIGGVHGRYPSPWGLWHLRAYWPVQTEVKVYPGAVAAADAALLARRSRTEAGRALVRSRGVFTEFESLRDYLPDDERRRINWTASARRGKLVVNQYQAERTQNVLLLVDAGRQMVPLVDGTPKLDYALSAAMVLGQVAAQQDDRVGLMIFAADVQHLAVPMRGRGQMLRLLEAGYNAQPEMIEPDYDRMVARVQQVLTKRSLVVCFTDLSDPDLATAQVQALLRLQRQHLLLLVTLTDLALVRTANTPATQVAEAFEAGVAAQVLSRREELLAQVRRSGAEVLDVPARELTVGVVNRYLLLKSRGRL